MLSTALLAASKKFWILDPLYAALGNILAFFYALIPSYGVAIILLTVTVSILRMPLVAKQVKSQQAMQRIQPELKKIQTKYKADPQKRNTEMMELYKVHGVNPFAGCLPLILQFPLFIVLYRIILNLSAVPPKHIPAGSELFKNLVVSGGKLKDFGLDLAMRASKVSGAGKIPYLLLVAIVVSTSFFQTRQMTARLPKEAQKNNQMAVMGKIMPAFMGLISFSIPAGVVLYFIVSNLWQIGQQYFLFRHQPAGGAAAPPAKAGGGGKDGGGGDSDGPPASAPPTKKGLLARLAEAANQTPAERMAPRPPPRTTPGKAGARPGAEKGTAKGDPRSNGKSGGSKPAKRSSNPPAPPPRRGLFSGRGGAAGAGGKGSGSGSSAPNGRPPRTSGRAQPPKNQSQGQTGPKPRNNRKGK